jgi:hypothetical protein
LPHPPGCPTHHGHAVVATEAPPTYPHHRPVVPAHPPPPSVDCRVIWPARRRRCAALPCCPLSSSCRPSKSSCILSPCCPLPLSCRVIVPPVAVVYRPSPLSCHPSKLIVESSGPLVAVVVPHVALTSAAAPARRPPLLVVD